MAGRAEHFRAKAKHAQRSVTYEKPAEIKMDSWLTESMEACRELAAAQDNEWGAEDFMKALNLDFFEADRRIRKLSQMGFLHMAAERDNGMFVRFVWGMVDVNLPRT